MATLGSVFAKGTRLGKYFLYRWTIDMFEKLEFFNVYHNCTEFKCRFWMHYTYIYIMKHTCIANDSIIVWVKVRFTFFLSTYECCVNKRITSMRDVKLVFFWKLRALKIMMIKGASIITLKDKSCIIFISIKNCCIEHILSKCKFYSLFIYHFT